MEAAVRGLVRFLNPLDGLDDVQCFDQARVPARNIADAANDGLLRTLRHVRRDSLRLQQGKQVVNLRLLRVLLDYNDRCSCPLLLLISLRYMCTKKADPPVRLIRFRYSPRTFQGKTT